MTERRPITFDGCFGWLYPGDRRRGVILCPAFGLEALSAHRAWAELAEALAAAGLPTLRFDWAGTFDSLGDDRDPARLDAWRASLSAAIDRLRDESDIDEIALVGLRLGATIAADVAASRDDVAFLVAGAAPITGAGWVREQRGLSRMLRVRTETDPADADEIGGFAVAGFFTADGTAEALKGLDCRTLPKSPAPRVVLLSREGDTGFAELAGRWRAEGADVREEIFVGVGALLTDPTRAVVPTADWSRIVDLLSEGAAVATDLARAIPETPRLETENWVEEPMLFGPAERLFGIVTTPRRPRADAPWVVLLDAGRNPHVGWGRGTVEAARAFAEDGRCVLRMDQAGIGDAHAHPGGPAEVLYSQESVADVVAAMDRLVCLGADRFVLIGACSGAHLALHTARVDPRVVGLAMINLQRFVWRDGDSLDAAMRGEYRSSSAYVDLIRRRDTWKRLFDGEIRVGSILLELGRRSIVRLVARVRRLVTVDPAVTWLRALDRRGVRVLFVFGTDDGGRDEFAAHVGPEEGLPDLVPGARLALIRRTDHNIGPREPRLELRRELSVFLDEVGTGL